MEFVDMHCDTLSMVLLSDPENRDLYHTKNTMLDLSRMREAGQLAQFFAVFMPPSEAFEALGIPPIDDDTYISTLRTILLDNVARHGDIVGMAYCAEDVRKNKEAGKMSAILTMEDSRAVRGDLSRIQEFHEMGFRAMSLTWNSANCFGFPNSFDPEIMESGLTSFGKEGVAYMQELGILVDVSHLSEGGFYDVADVCKKPFVATHSNCRGKLCSHPRGLTDDQLRVLAEAGGVAGLNYCPEFLTPDPDNHRNSADLIARHARHMADVAGVDCIGLGSDFDGFKGDLEVGDSRQVCLLEDALKKQGFTASETEKIFSGNVLRVMEDAMH